MLYTLSCGSVEKWCAGAVLPRLPPQCRCGDLLLIYRRMMPRVGRGSRPGVYYNTGHGHLGWTLSAATASMISEVIGQDLTVAMPGLLLAG